MKKNHALYLNILHSSLQFIILIGFLFKEEYFLALNPVLISLFYLLIILLEKYSSFKLENYIRILLIITLISHTLIGTYFAVYDTNFIFDKILHLFGTFAFALLAYKLLTAFMDVRSSRPRLFTFILITFSGLTLGALFELVEFTTDFFFDEDSQDGLLDTNLDLFMDLLGAILAGIFMAFKDPLWKMEKMV